MNFLILKNITDFFPKNYYLKKNIVRGLKSIVFVNTTISSEKIFTSWDVGHELNEKP